jgi:hypothetical protein
VWATPNREMAADWRVSPWGMGIATARLCSTAMELARWSLTTRSKSCTTGREREEGEVGIMEGEEAWASGSPSG